MSQDHCDGCGHLTDNPYGGYCYMFRERPSNPNCAQHTKYPKYPYKAARVVVALECLRIALEPR